MERKKRMRKSLFCLLLACGLLLGVGSTAGVDKRNRNMINNKNYGAGATLPAAVWTYDSVNDEELSFLPADFAWTESEYENLRLCPGGMPFGIKFLTEGVSVVGFCDVEEGGKKYNPALESGLRLRDVILAVNGETLESAADLTDKIEASKGQEVTLSCRRGKTDFSVNLKPIYSKPEARYKTGIWVRDSGAGIGTVTFVLPESGAFAGLGHGICEAETGELINMKRGSVSGVTISSVIRGAAGAPGELKGYFNPGKKGNLLGNTPCGVWGVFTELPKSLGEALPVGVRGELKEGSAEILCTLDNNTVGRYTVQISNINLDSKSSKCFSVTVTDPNLLAASGGIVQGMSGSPIIQNGKLVGAVTHVLINDPATGYGIFLENMLSVVQMGVKR